MILTWELLLMPIIGGLIGWLTNVVAIKMLFWPKIPVTIPIFGWQFLGLLPKRKADLARSVGQTVDNNLLPMDEVLTHFKEGGYQEHIVDAIVNHVDIRLREMLPRFLPENVKALVRDFVQDAVSKESARVITQVADSTMDKLREEVRFGELVETKIQSFDLDELEGLIKGIASQELKFIELLGALLGFLIGLLQTGFLLWLFR